MSLKFLNRHESALEYLKTDYFDQMNLIELNYRLNSLNYTFDPQLSCQTLRENIRNCYTTKTVDFNQTEKNVISFYFKHLFNLLWNKAPGLIPQKQDIDLIKLQINVDWNFPYTINHAIVIPSLFLNNLVNTYHQYYDQISKKPLEVWNPTRTHYDDFIDQKTCVLCHELIHILQRNKTLYPEHHKIFNHIYEKIWGFQSIDKSMIKWSHQNEETFFNVLTNPDGYNYEWMIPIYNHETNYNHLFLPLLSRNLENKPIGILVEINETNHNQYLVTKHWNDINSIKRYVQKFYGLTKQLYHPNEISSHLIASYVVLDQIHSDSQNTYDYYSFYQFINKHLISINFTPFRQR